MKNFLSVISYTFLLFSSIHILCSDCDDFSSSQNYQSTRKKRLIPPTQQTQASSIFTSPEAIRAAEITTTVVTTIGSVGYQAGSWAFSKAMDAYKQRNQSLDNVHYNKQSLQNDFESDCASNSDSGSDSSADFCKVKSKKETIKRKSFFRDQNELQESLEKDAGKTINKLTQVAKDYFKKQDPEDLITQKDMRHTFTLLQDSTKHAKQLGLDPIIADDYNIQQRNLLTKTIQDHVDNIEPEFEMTHEAAKRRADNEYNRRVTNAKKKHDRAIKQAESAYNHSLNKSKNILETFAFNSAYLNNRASNKESHPAHELANFTSQESYKNFLADMRQLKLNQSIVSEQNNSSSTQQADLASCTTNAVQSNEALIPTKTKKGKHKNSASLQETA